MKKIDDLIEWLWDKIFWAVAINLVLVLAIVGCGFQVLFPRTTDFFLDKFFSTPADGGDIVSGYQKFSRNHPRIAWCLQWPLMLFAM